MNAQSRLQRFSFRGLLLATGMAAALFGGCQKASVTLTAFMGEYDAGGKAYMMEHSAIWNENDKVVVNGRQYEVSGSGNGVSLTVYEAASYQAVFPAQYVESGTTSLSIPRSQTCQVDAYGHQKVMAPMGAYSQDGATLQFTPLGALLAIDIANDADQGTLVLDKVAVKSSSSALWGYAEVEGMATDTRKLVITDAFQSGVNDYITLVGDAGGSLDITIARGSSQTLYVSLPALEEGVDERLTFFVFSHVAGSDAQHEYSISLDNAFNGSASLAKMAAVPFAMSAANEIAYDDPDIVEGCLPGIFSVSATKRVCFSQGNLQWTSTGSHAVNGDGTAAGTWRFAEHQYDMVGSPSQYNSSSVTSVYNMFPGNVSGSDNADISPTYTGWIDLFGWGTSGYHDNSDPYNTNYYPYSVSYYENDIPTYNNHGYGPSTNMSSPNLTGASANYDWGVYNAISNGGNHPNQWRTLTDEEWDYLYRTRTKAKSKWGTGRIQLTDGSYVHGCIFLPDSWTLPSGCSFKAGIASSESETDYSRNTYTLYQWSRMETAGALFLPAAGDRSGTDVYNVGGMGHYWSSSYDDSYFAIYFCFNGSGMGTFCYRRCEGLAVRLVRDYY